MSTLWKLLAGLGLGAAAVPDEAEAALIPANLLKNIPGRQLTFGGINRLHWYEPIDVQKNPQWNRARPLPGYSLGDRLEKVGNRINKYADDVWGSYEGATLKPRHLLPANKRLYYGTGGSVFVDDQGVPRLVTRDDFNRPKTLKALTELTNAGPGNAFTLGDVTDPNSIFSVIAEPNRSYDPLVERIKVVNRGQSDTNWGTAFYNGRSDPRANLFNLEERDLPDIMETLGHEATGHLVSATAGLPHGSSVSWFNPDKFWPYGEFFENPNILPIDLYVNTLDEQLAHVAGKIARNPSDTDVLQELASYPWSWNPASAVDAYTGQNIWRDWWMGDVYPHRNAPINKLLHSTDPDDLEKYNLWNNARRDWIASASEPLGFQQIPKSKLKEYGPSIAGLTLGMLPGAVPQVLSNLFDAVDLVANPPTTQEEEVTRRLPNMSITAQAALEDPYIMSLFTGY